METTTKHTEEVSAKSKSNFQTSSQHLQRVRREVTRFSSSSVFFSIPSLVVMRSVVVCVRVVTVISRNTSTPEEPAVESLGAHPGDSRSVRRDPLHTPCFPAERHGPSPSTPARSSSLGSTGLGNHTHPCRPQEPYQTLALPIVPGHDVLHHGNVWWFEGHGGGGGA